MTKEQAIANIKQGYNIPCKHETISTLITMADKLEKIEQLLNENGYIWSASVYERLKEILGKE
jgi:hypothetical protein